MEEITTPALYRGGQGEPLLLLHGFKGTWHQWQPIIGALVGDYEVIAPTLPGHHGGPVFEKTGALRVTDAGDAVERQLDELGLATAHIVGNSMGGGLALELAKRGRARSVVAIAPSGGWRPDSGESRRLARFFVRQRRLVRAGRAALPAVMGRSTTRRLAMRDVMWRGERMTPRAAIDMVVASAACPIEGRVIEALFAGRATLDGLDAVRVPTLVAWPEHDRILPMGRHAERFRSEIPGAEFVVLGATGHVPMWDRPQLVVSTVQDFVTRRSARSAAAGEDLAGRAPISRAP